MPRTEQFNGLAAQFEVAEEARVILTSNLAVEQGLMNGTQGVVKRIISETKQGQTMKTENDDSPK